MSTYAEQQDERVRRIAEYLTRPGHINKGLNRKALAKRITKPDLVIDSHHITALWPRVQALVADIGDAQGCPLFAVRPIGRWKYMCAATTLPLYAAYQQAKRDRYIVSMMLNDQIGGIDLHLADHSVLMDATTRGRIVTRMWKREGYLSGTSVADLETEIEMIAETLLSLEEIPA